MPMKLYVATHNVHKLCEIGEILPGYEIVADDPDVEETASDFAGNGFECMKKQGRGTHGHIAIGCNSVARAKWHLEQRGYAFDKESAAYKNGKLNAIYLKDEIAGFAFHLVQK